MQAEFHKYAGNDFSLIEHPAMDRGKFIIDDKRRVIYCGCIYQAVFGTSKNFDEALDHSIEIAKNRVNKHIDDLIEQHEIKCKFRTWQPVPLQR